MDSTGVFHTSEDQPESSKVLSRRLFFFFSMKTDIAQFEKMINEINQFYDQNSLDVEENINSLIYEVNSPQAFFYKKSYIHQKVKSFQRRYPSMEENFKVIKTVTQPQEEDQFSFLRPPNPEQSFSSPPSKVLRQRLSIKSSMIQPKFEARKQGNFSEDFQRSFAENSNPNLAIRLNSTMRETSKRSASFRIGAKPPEKIKTLNTTVGYETMNALDMKFSLFRRKRSILKKILEEYSFFRELSEDGEKLQVKDLERFCEQRGFDLRCGNEIFAMFKRKRNEPIGFADFLAQVYPGIPHSDVKMLLPKVIKAYQIQKL